MITEAKILKHLKRPRTVREIAARLEVPTLQVYRKISDMLDAGQVECRGRSPAPSTRGPKPWLYVRTAKPSPFVIPAWAGGK